ncbi:hypothetical protein [Lentibacillus saliphilus]|uniref:hypothetical protein n=1 Tax=Lentibacillus saliphilus TaxID=2737028 RepID=UPI001C2FD046|nr:hypothetical protein [Lentibacillus saliphilus]
MSKPIVFMKSDRLVNAEHVTRDETRVSILPATEDALKKVNNNNDAYMPWTLLPTNRYEGLNVYFDLEAYAFFQRTKELIQEEADPKGVLRFRRTVKQHDQRDIFTGDLYVLLSLFGALKRIDVKQTHSSSRVPYTIVIASWKNGTMAHLEYTVADDERIELEWSSTERIIEFDSEHLRPVEGFDLVPSPLVHEIKTILSTAHKADAALLTRLTELNELIHGGDQ